MPATRKRTKYAAIPPVRSAASRYARKPASSGELSHLQINAKVPGRILVIDDEKSARLLLERVLSRAGHEVVLVDTGEAGLERLAKDEFDLIITDKNLPGIDGLEVLRLARTQHPLLQAIV